MKLSELRNKYKGTYNTYIKDEFKKDDEINTEVVKTKNIIKEVKLDTNTYRKTKMIDSLDSNNVESDNDNIQINNIVSDNNEEENKILDNMKIIGITGSKGKSTIAYLIHSYLKSTGHKSILYSSIVIDSPCTSRINLAKEEAIKSMNTFLSILDEAILHKAEYLVLELNETILSSNEIKDIPFDVKILTNIYNNSNLDKFENNEYVSLKKNFIINTNKDCTCILGLNGNIDRNLFNELLNSNDSNMVTFSSKFICEIKNCNYNNIDYLLMENERPLLSMDGLNFDIRIKDETRSFKTNLLLTQNALNITCVVSALNELNVFDYDKFNSLISNINIPGREEVIKYNNRTIIFGLTFNPMVETLKKLSDVGEINKIKVLYGPLGYGFVTWDEASNSIKRINRLSLNHKYAMEYVQDYIDEIYLTSNDPAKANKLDLIEDCASYITKDIKVYKIEDRKEALRRIIRESNEGDVIYIAGRGNREIYCMDESHIELFSDREIVEEELYK